MTMAQICARCGLTKKAVEYYERKGLIQPLYRENGYRDYSEAEVKRLQEIAVLRRLGLSVAEIGAMLDTEHKQAALRKHRHVAALQQQARAQQMDALIADYDIERAFAEVDDEKLLSIRERLAWAFPGDFGVFTSLHFGHFLDGRIDSPAKQAAYDDMVRYLETVDFQIPEALSALWQEATQAAVHMEGAQHEGMQTMLDAPAQYFDEHAQFIEDYLAFRHSQEYAQSPAGQLMEAVTAFQQMSGYDKHIVANMRILSDAYAAYWNDLQAANAQFIARFPTSPAPRR